MKPNRVKSSFIFFIMLAVFFSVLSSCGENKNNLTETESSGKIPDTENQIEYSEPENGFWRNRFRNFFRLRKKTGIDPLNGAFADHEHRRDSKRNQYDSCSVRFDYGKRKTD